jgi:hypothetical protein
VKVGKQGQMLAVAKVDSLREGQKDPFPNADPNLTDHSIHIEFI